MTTSSIHDLNQRLREQIRHAYTNAPAVQRRFDEAGLSPDDVQGLDDLAQIPVMPKDDLVALQQADPPFGGLLAAPMDQVRHIFFSPGPIYEPDTDEDSSLDAMAQEALRRSGFQAGDIVLNTLSYHLVPAGLMLDKALTGMGCVAVPGGVGNRDLQLKMMADLGVTGYVGTPSFLLALLEKADSAGLPLGSLGKALCTAEPLFPHQREKLTARGLTVGNAYATAELGFLALNTDGGREMRLLPEPIIQVVDPETGQDAPPGSPGEVVVTNFSRAYPLIRLGTGDMAILLDPGPGRSRQEERAIILVGRSGEAKKVRGMFVHPNQLRFAVGQLIPGAAVQGAVQHDAEGKDFFIVRVAAAGNDAQAAAVAEAVRQLCRVRVNRVEWVEALPDGGPGMADERAWA